MASLPQRWQVVILALVMQMLVVGFGIYCFTFFVIPWMEDFDAQRGDLMLGYTGHSLVAAMVSPFCGFLIDRYPVRRLTMGAVTIFCVALVLIARAPTAQLVAATYALLVPIGLLLGGALMGQALVARAFTENQGRALGIAALGTSLGGLVMPIAVTGLLEAYHWREVFDFVAITTAVIVLPLAFFVLRPGSDMSHGVHAGPPARSTGELLRDPSVAFVAIAFVMLSGLFIGVQQNVGPLAADLAITQRQAGIVMSISALLMAVGKFTIGSLADRVRHLTLYGCLTAMSGAGLVLTATAASVVPFAIGVFLVGIAGGAAFPLISTATLHHFGAANFGRVVGIVLAVGGLSGVVPLFASWMRDTSGSYGAAFLSLLPLLVVGLLCFRLFAVRRPPQPAFSPAVAGEG